MAGCPSYDVLRRFTANGLPAAETAVVESHLVDCADCREWLAREPTAEFIPSPSPDVVPIMSSTGHWSGPAEGAGPSLRSWDMVPPGGRFARGDVVAGRYQVERFLGRGGMGEVWLVRDMKFDSLRALKIILSGFPPGGSAALRFVHEAKVMARLNHPHSVVIHDAELSDGQVPYIVMEYVEGKSLDKILEKGKPMSLAWTARVVEQLCDLLKAAHGQEPPVVHRDLKPSNLMLLDGRRDGSEHLKVLDFGLAKTLTTDGKASDASETGGPVGTPRYASPEQLEHRPVDARSDIYSAGVILYEFLTGHTPFDGSRDQLKEHHLNTAPPPFALRNHASNVPDEVEAVVMRCLEKESGLRPHSAQQLADDFRHAAGLLPQRNEGPSNTGRGGSWKALAAALTVALIAAGIVYRIGAGRPSAQPAAGPAEVLRAIGSDIQDVPVADRPFVRYFSLRHLIDEGADGDVLAQHRSALAAAVNYLSRRKEAVRLTPVDRAGTVFRIDIRHALWDEKPFVEAESTRVSPVNLYDLVLLEYPYGLVPERSDEFAVVGDRFLTQASQVRPVPYLRADWFVAVATRPPLYRDLLRLPIDLKTLEKRLEASDDSASGQIDSSQGNSPHGTHVQSQATRDGSLWRTFRDPPGDVLFSLANGLSGFAHVGPGGVLALTDPADLGSADFRGGLDCLRCHDQGVQLIDGQAPINTALTRDRGRHATALANVLGLPPSDSPPPNPITSVAKRYLDEPITLRRAAAELGFGDSSVLVDIFTLPRFQKLGLNALSTGGTVGRDDWESAFPALVRHLGLGSPIAPGDGLSRGAARSLQGDVALELSTNHRDNRFRPGDGLFLRVKNRSGHDLRVDLLVTDKFGRMTVVPPESVTITAGAEYRYPPSREIEVQLPLGMDRYTVYATTGNAPPGLLLSAAQDDAADRFLHRPPQPGFDALPGVDPPEVFKSTIAIETY